MTMLLKLAAVRQLLCVTSAPVKWILKRVVSSLKKKRKKKKQLRILSTANLFGALTLKALITTAADYNFFIFFLFFRVNKS